MKEEVVFLILCILVDFSVHVEVYVTEEFIESSIDVFPWIEKNKKRSSVELFGNEGIILDLDETQINDLKKVFGKRMVNKVEPPCGFGGRVSCLREGYKNYTEIVEWMDKKSKNYTKLANLFSIGKTVNGMDIYVMEISDKTDPPETTLNPNVKFVANMHGDEITGVYLILQYIDYLLSGYGNDPTITSLVKSINFYFIPSLNPDGMIACIRNNGNNIDLNRKFPDPMVNEEENMDKREPEIRSIMNFTKTIQFTLSANMHGGEVVANYPFDNGDEAHRYTDDQDIFEHLSIIYSKNNPPMYTNKDFENGITNGADWYIIPGGMQDWNYVYAGCMELTLEVSCEKWPPFSEMNIYWEDNKNSLIEYSKQALMGLRGYVFDIENNSPVQATIQVKNRNFKVYSDPLFGKYFRILLPGTYEVTATAEGYEPLTVTVDISPSLFFTHMDFGLIKISDDEEEDMEPPNIVDFSIHKDIIKPTLDIRSDDVSPDYTLYFFILFLFSLGSILFLYYRRRFNKKRETPSPQAL